MSSSDPVPAVLCIPALHIYLLLWVINTMSMSLPNTQIVHDLRFIDAVKITAEDYSGGAI